MQSGKETASNVAASAKSGMEKTKAVAQEKAEKMTTRDPLKKEMAEQKKDARINEAERMKHDTRAENTAARRDHGHGYGHDHTATGYSTGTTDHPTGYTHSGTGTGATGYSTGTTDHPTGYTHSGTGTGATGYTTGTTDLPSGYTAEGTFGEDYPADSEFLSGTHTGSGAGTQDPRVARGRHTGYGTGGGTY